MNTLPRRIPKSLAHNLRATALALLITALAFIAAQLMQNVYYGLPMLVIIVMLTARSETGVVWGMVTALLSLLVYCALALAVSSEIPLAFVGLSAIALVGSAAVTGGLSARIREQQNAHREQSYRDRLISEMNLKLLMAPSDEELYRSTLRYLYDVSGLPSSFYIMDEDGFRMAASYPDGLILYPTEYSAAREAFDSGMYTGFGTGVFKGSSFRYIPVKLRSDVLAVVGVMCDFASPPDVYMMKTVEMMLARAGVALEKQRLSRENRKSEMEKELERMRSDFLRAISHDFRSPLTGIIGACSALNETGVELTEANRHELIDSINEEAAWLLRMVENLLSVTRVSPSGPALKKSPEPVEEVLTETLQRAKKRFPDEEFHVEQPDDFIMIPMDAMMIVQVLMNLIENAVRYSEGTSRIDITVADGEKFVTFSVRDYGKGLAEDKLGSLFKPAAMIAGDSRHGMGLGLSICRSVIRAHGGEVEGSNSEDGGAVFSFTLPKE